MSMKQTNSLWNRVKSSMMPWWTVIGSLWTVFLQRFQPCYSLRLRHCVCVTSPPVCSRLLMLHQDPAVVRGGPFSTQVCCSKYRRTVAFPVRNEYHRSIMVNFYSWGKLELQQFYSFCLEMNSYLGIVIYRLSARWHRGKTLLQRPIKKLVF